MKLRTQGTNRQTWYRDSYEPEDLPAWEGSIRKLTVGTFCIRAAGVEYSMHLASIAGEPVRLYVNFFSMPPAAIRAEMKAMGAVYDGRRRAWVLRMPAEVATEDLIAGVKRRLLTAVAESEVA